MLRRLIPTSFRAGRVLKLGTMTAPLVAPVLSKGATSGTGGTFTAGSVFWVITAENAAGETVKSNEVTSVMAATSSQVLNWVAVPGATGYRIYRGTATGVYTKRVIALGLVTTHTDVGNAGTTASPPDVNSTPAPIVYAVGDLIPIGVIRTLNNLSALLGSRRIIPNVDPHYRKTKLTTGAPTDVSPPSVRRAI